MQTATEQLEFIQQYAQEGTPFVTCVTCGFVRADVDLGHQELWQCHECTENGSPHTRLLADLKALHAGCINAIIENRGTIKKWAERDGGKENINPAHLAHIQTSMDGFKSHAHHLQGILVEYGAAVDQTYCDHDFVLNAQDGRIGGQDVQHCTKCFKYLYPKEDKK